MDRGAWYAAVRQVAKSWTWLSDFTFTFHFHALEKELATHSSVLAWRFPSTGEPGGLPSMGSHRVGRDWSDLAAVAAAAVGCVIRLASFLLLWFQCVCLLMPSRNTYCLTWVFFLGHGVSLHSCSSKAQRLLLTLDEGYLLWSLEKLFAQGHSPRQVEDSEFEPTLHPSDSTTFGLFCMCYFPMKVKPSLCM